MKVPSSVWSVVETSVVLVLLVELVMLVDVVGSGSTEVAVEAGVVVALDSSLVVVSSPGDIGAEGPQATSRKARQRNGDTLPRYHGRSAWSCLRGVRGAG